MSTPGSRTLLAMITVQREPSYIDKTLQSLFEASPEACQDAPIHLLVGGRSTTYLETFQGDPRVRIHPLTSSEADQIEALPPSQRFSTNYLRALALPLEGYGGICILEDDLIFRNRFQERLLEVLTEIEGMARCERYILAGYCSRDLETMQDIYRGKLHCKYPARRFYGTQCTYFTSNIIQDVARSIRSLALEGQRIDGDDAIRDHCVAAEAATGTELLFACTRSLVQHIGLNSTGLAHFSHQSPSFCRPWVPLDSWQRPAWRRAIERPLWRMVEFLERRIVRAWDTLKGR